MTKATRVYITPPPNTSANNPPDQPTTRDDEIGMAWWNALTKQERAKWSAIAGNTGRPKDAWEAFKRGSMDQSPPVDPTRRRFLAVAAVASVVSAGTLAAATAMDPGVPAAVAGIPTSVDPIYAAIARHRAEQQAYGDALMALAELHEIVPHEIWRSPRVQWGMKGGEPFYVHSHQQIDDRLKWVPDFARTPKIRAELHDGLAADLSELSTKQDEHGVTAANDRVEQLCHSCQELAWKLANTMPTSMAGVAAALRYANEWEDVGEEWPDTDTIGRDGWHYQLRATTAAAIEAIIRQMGV